MSASSPTNGNSNSMAAFPPWVRIVAQVGFPIAVTAFLLIRMAGALDANTAAVRDLAEQSQSQGRAFDALTGEIRRGRR